jgi:hypothetical protein
MTELADYLHNPAMRECNPGIALDEPGKKPKKTKYYASDGTELDSKGELDRYEDLLMFQKCGDIYNLKAHPRYTLQEVPRLRYKPDFVYIVTVEYLWQDYSSKLLRGEMVIEEIKAVTKGGKLLRAETSLVRMKMLKNKYPRSRCFIGKPGMWREIK